MIKKLKIIKLIKTNNYHICCIIWKNHKNLHTKCEIKGENYKTCLNMLGNIFEIIFLWFINIFLLTAILFSFLLLFNTKKKIFKLQYLTLTSDIFIISYLLIVTVIGHYFNDNFYEMSNNWNENILCQILGFLFNISILIDSLTLFFKTIHIYQIV